MVDVKKLEQDFIERRGDNPPAQVMVFTYKKGLGAMVIDMDKFNKLPKSKQNKIMKLAEQNGYEIKNLAEGK